MSLKKIIDNCTGLDQNLNPFSYTYFDGPFFNGSARILDMSFIFTKATSVPFILEVFNCGFNYEKFILMTRFTNNPNDLLYQEALPFKKNTCEIYYDFIGKGELAEFYIYNFSETETLELGLVNYISEIESV